LGRRGAQAELAQQLGIRARYGSDVLRGPRAICARLLE
jgi:hypothetical protein